MKMTNLKKSLLLFLCIVLIAVMALFTTGCNNKETPDENPSEISSQENMSNDNEDGNENFATKGYITVGNGKNQFSFSVTHTDGTTRTYNVRTDKTIVGEALLELGIIDGEAGQYGLYVKKVNGETLDYETDGMYWAFYVDGVYGTTGVDQTKITAGASYEFRAAE